MVQIARDMNPEWDAVLWDERDLREACYAFDERCGRTFDAYPIMHQKIDLGRYVVLYHHGGISLDTDAVCIRGFDDVPFPDDAIMVTEIDLSWLERCAYGNWNNATIYSPYPKHEEMHRMVNLVLDQGIGSPYVPDWVRVTTTTGPYRFQKVVSELTNVKAAPGTWFEPCVMSDCNITDDTIVSHSHTASWVEFPYDECTKAYAYARKPIRWVLEAMVLLVLFVSLWFVVDAIVQRPKSR